MGEKRGNKIPVLSSFQLLSHVWLFATPCTAAHRVPCPPPTPIVCSNSCPLNQWCHPTISSSVVPFSSHLQLSQHQGLFQWVSFSIRWPKYWGISFSISLSNEYSALISFRMDWLDLLTVQGTLKSLLYHHISKASIFRCSAFFMVLLSHPYITAGKTNHSFEKMDFCWQSNVSVFNILSRLVMTFLPRSKCLLLSRLQSPSAVILEPPKIVCHCFHCCPIYLPWGDGIWCHDLSFLTSEF